jgi:Short C-terminal domain
MIGAGDLVLESAGEFGQETFSDVREPERVQKVIYEMGERNQRAMTAPAPVAMSASTADELDKLARLRADGVLSEQEFQAQKARLLGQG